MPGRDAPGRSAAGLADAATATISAWHRYTETGGMFPGDPTPVGEAIAGLADALAEIGAATVINLDTLAGLSLAGTLGQAITEARDDGRPSVITAAGETPVLIIPAASATGTHEVPRRIRARRRTTP